MENFEIILLHVEDIILDQFVRRVDSHAIPLFFLEFFCEFLH